MGLFTRTRTAPVRLEPTLAPPETRAATYRNGSDGWGATSLGFTGGNVGAVPTYLAENLSSVTGAIELIASGVASLPASLQIDTPDGRKPAPDSAPAWRILTRPCHHMSWPAFVSAMVGSLLLHGNALAYIVRDGRGAPVSLVPVPWGWVNPVVIRGAGGPRLVFDVVNSTAEAELLGLPRRILDGEALFVRGRGDATIGRSVLHRAASVISEAIAVQEAAAALWRNGLRPSASLTTDQAIDDDGRARLRSRLQEFTGAGNVAKVLILEQGLKYNAIAMTSADAEMLATRRLSVEEVARLFLIPTGMLQPGQGASAAPAELQAQFAQQALAPVVNLLEAEFDHAVLPDSMHLQIDLAGLMRGSYAALVGAQAVALQAGALTANDVRRSLGLPALAGGDSLCAPGQVPGFPSDSKGVPSLAPKPGPGRALPNIGSHENDGAGG